MAMEDEREAFRVLEFYSGIGGMRFSLKRAGIHAIVVEAFDINNIANDVYEHNFRHCPYQGNIQSLTAAQLDKFRAHAWLLSPPCQPYTRQGLQKDAEDARASSFLKILQLIPLTLYPPTKLFVENVVGFECSNTHKQMMLALEKTGFATQEFILSPLQFGVPYSRPRYFCLAKKAPLSFTRPEFNGQLLSNIPPLISGEDDRLQKDRVPFNGTDKQNVDNMHEVVMDPHISCRPIKDFLEADSIRSDRIGGAEMGSSRNNECLLTEKAKDDSEDPHSKRDYRMLNGKQHLVHNRDFHMSFEYDCEGGIVEDNCFTSIYNEDHFRTSRWDQYRVPVSLIERWGDAMDIVFPESRRCCCFTKSYGRYVKGTGSFLATAKDVPNNGFLNENELRVEMKNNVSLLQELGLRYFTPREVANLHSFPEEFNFPIHVSLRQRYALLGNSLSIAVVAPLFKYLFTD